jgi:hypothetical protein
MTDLAGLRRATILAEDPKPDPGEHCCSADAVSPPEIEAGFS